MTHESQVNNPEILRQQLLQDIWGNAERAISLDGRSLGSTDSVVFNPKVIRDENGRPLARTGPSIGIWKTVNGGSPFQDGPMSLGDIGIFRHDEEVATSYSPPHLSSEYYSFQRRPDGKLDVERTLNDGRGGHSENPGYGIGSDRQASIDLAESLGLNRPSNDELAELNDLLADRVQDLVTKKAQERRQQRPERIRGIGRATMRLLRFRSKR